MQKCYCKSGLEFSACCEPFLRVLEVAPTALSLMRSRYSAYCLGDVNYLQATTHDHTWSDEELNSGLGRQQYLAAFGDSRLCRRYGRV